MNLRNSVLFLATAAFATLAASTARAQAAIYGTFTVNELGGLKSSPLANSLVIHDSVVPIGGTLGAYYDFMKLGPVKLGADLRGTLTTTNQDAYYSSGYGSRLYSGLGGIRAVFHTRWTPIRPYVQGSVGFARTDYGFAQANSGTNNNIKLTNNFQYEGFAGVDITLLPVMDFRVVEFGYGGLSNNHNYPIKSVSSGLVFHLPF